jgi:hypothetical protein
MFRSLICAVLGGVSFVACGGGTVENDYQLVGDARNYDASFVRALETWNHDAAIVDGARNTLRLADESELVNGRVLEDGGFATCWMYESKEGSRYTEIVIAPWLVKNPKQLHHVLLHEIGHSIRFLRMGDADGAETAHLPRGNIMGEIVNFDVTSPTDTDYEFVGTEKPSDVGVVVSSDE